MAAYGDYLIARPKESDVDIPESLEELEKTFPHGSDWMRLLRASSKFLTHFMLIRLCKYREREMYMCSVRELYTSQSQNRDLKPDFHMVVTVVKIESRSFSSAEIQHFSTENTRSDYN